MSTRIIDTVTFCLIGEGATKEEAIQDALENAYWSVDGNQLITREILEDEIANNLASNGAKGFFFETDPDPDPDDEDAEMPVYEVHADAETGEWLFEPYNACYHSTRREWARKKDTDDCRYTTSETCLIRVMLKKQN